MEICRVEIEDFQEHVELTKTRKKKYKLDKEGMKVLANPRSFDKPRLWKVAGQALYNATLHRNARNKASSWAHQYFRPFIKDMPKLDIKKGQYLSLHLELHDVAGEENWDCDNKWPWIKWFQDTLVESKKIPGDDIRYIRDSGRIIFREIEEGQKRKMVFIISEYQN